MKLHKLISRTVLATALLGATFGGAFAGINANAGEVGSSDSGSPQLSRNGNSASMQPNTKVDIQGGFLTLDSVPQLSFGKNSSVEGQAAQLKLNDGNHGTLKVTDYRNQDKVSGNSTNGNQDAQGWQLSAQLDNFNNQDNNTTDGNSDRDGDWVMNLTNTNISNNKDEDGSNGNTPKVNTPSLTAGASSSSDVIDNNNGKRGFGINTIPFDSSNNASLNIPNVEGGTYNARITWTLSTDATSYNTSYNS